MFLSITGLFLVLSILWGYQYLPKENWQILAVLPRKKTAQGQWIGLNLTYYGFLCATANAFAVVMFLILSSAAEIPLSGACLLIVSLLLICLPAAKLIARLVEKKSSTLTVGGAVFAGTLASPLLVYCVNHTLGKTQGFSISVSTFLAAASIAYAYGEGLGRLACISFGCCYGKPVASLPLFVQKLFARFYLRFSGATKKITYASGLDNTKVVPVQIITAIIYCGAALAGTGIYLAGEFRLAFVSSLLITQIWRFLSEFLRADFRGSLKITPYQVMAGLTIVYAVTAACMFHEQSTLPVLTRGLSCLWNPGIIFFIEGIWVTSFLYTGRSQVTGAQIRFHVNHSKS